MTRIPVKDTVFHDMNDKSGMPNQLRRGGLPKEPASG
jgi:hypothetical protein